MIVTPVREPPARQHPLPAGAGAGRLTALALAAILVLALGLRLWGLGWGLPWAFHADEINYVDHAQDLVTRGSANPHYFENPSLLTYLIAAELLAVRALGPLAF